MVNFENYRHDVDNMQLTVKYKIPLINFTGTYEIKGRILVLPIEGNGYLEIDAGKIFVFLAYYKNYFGVN